MFAQLWNTWRGMNPQKNEVLTLSDYSVKTAETSHVHTLLLGIKTTPFFCNHTHFQHLEIRALGRNLCGFDSLGPLECVSFIINIAGAVNIWHINEICCLIERGHLPSAHLHDNNARLRTQCYFAGHTHNDVIKGRAGEKVLSMSRPSVLEFCLGCKGWAPFERDVRYIEFNHNPSHMQRRGLWKSSCCISPTMELKCAHCFSEVENGKQTREPT